jgi:membrane protease YdiL (CAAX protease family)
MIILILFFTYCASFILAVLELIIKRELFILRLALLDLVVILVIGYFIKYVYKSSLRILGLKIKDALSALPWAVISYIAFIPIFVVVLISNMRIMNLLNYEPKVPPVFGFVLEGKNIFSLVLFMVLVGVIAPIVEELFFRGFLYNASKKYLGKTLSVAITTVLFALLHQELFQFAPIVFIGLLLIYVYEKTGSLWTAIMVHSIHNISTTYLVLLIKSLLLR